MQSDPFEQGHKSSIKQETTIQWKDEHLNADDDDDFDNSTSLPETVCYNSVNLFFRPKAKDQPRNLEIHVAYASKKEVTEDNGENLVLSIPPCEADIKFLRLYWRRVVQCSQELADVR